MARANYTRTKSILLFEGSSRSAYWRRFVALLTLSVIIATMGLLRNSGAVVIAAMLVAPLMTPILGTAAAMVMGWTGRTLILFACVLAAACWSIILAWIMMFVADVPRGLLIPPEVLARTDPGIEELIVALAAGAAGAYVQLNRDEVSLLPGAAIGVSLVPPLSAAGILLYFREWDSSYEAVLLFLTNFAAIVLSACSVYVFSAASGAMAVRRSRVARFTASFAMILFMFAAIVVQLTTHTIDRFRESRLEHNVALAFEQWAGDFSVEVLRIDVKPKKKLAEAWIIVDLPVAAGHIEGSVYDLLPARFRDGRLIEVLAETLGPEYRVAIRFNTRIAGLVDLQTRTIEEVLPVEDVTAEE